MLAAHGRKGGEGAHRADDPALVPRSVRLGAVLDDRQVVRVSQVQNGVHIRRFAGDVGDDNGLCPRRDHIGDLFRADVVGAGGRIGDNGDTV